MLGNQSAEAVTGKRIGVGQIYALVVDPHTPGTLYAGTECRGLMKSTDGGATWFSASAGLPAGFVQPVVDPLNTDTLYATTYDIYDVGVFKSTDGATSWHVVTGLADAAVSRLAFDLEKPGTLYAAGRSGVYRSTDAGATWTLRSTGDLFPSWVCALVAAADTPDKLYAGTVFGGLLESTNAGDAWSHIANGSPLTGACLLAVDPSMPNTLYTAFDQVSGASLWKSTDGGGTWKGMSAGAYVQALAIDPTSTTTLYAVISRPPLGVYKSTDGGATWGATGLQWPDSSVPASVLAVDPLASGTVYALARELWRSTDDGSTWHTAGLVGSAICGDRLVCGAEECDDGNTVSGDGCDANCAVTRCGNGTVTFGEQCDDGNVASCDGCSSACRIEVGFRCGDGVINTDCHEQCDDGNRINGDGCEADCTLPRCGDRIIDSGEECDDGNLVDADGCEANCTLPRRGNGVLDPGEECDDGNTISGDGCDANGTVTRCGNGIVTAGEEYDDGNLNPFDGCTAACTICGNGIVTPPEQCDDGNTDPFDGCTNACTVCGNGIVTPPEACDDRNHVNGDTCNADCILAGVCGNGVVDGDEDCDDGGLCIGSLNAGTFCTANTQCPGGTCQTFGGDGCAANCTNESDVAFNLLPGIVHGNDLAPDTSGMVIRSDLVTIPVASSGSQTLTIGRERNGQISVVIKAAAVHFDRVPVSTLSCLCPRAVAAKTCGGTLFEADGLTRSLDCTPGFTAGDSVCLGKKPCAYVHGPGNSAAGTIGCGGLDGIDLSLTQDAGGSSGVPQPPLLLSTGRGDGGSALLSVTTATNSLCVCNEGGCSACPSLCYGSDPSIYGPDGQFCTDDDPQSQRGTPVTGSVTTGMVTGLLLNSVVDGNDVGPFSISGHSFRCSALANGDVSGAVLASVQLQLGTPLDDVLTTSLAVAAPSPCAGDCDDDGAVTVDEVVTLVNIALGNAQASICLGGVPGRTLDIGVIIQAVNNALGQCPGPPRSPTATQP